MGKKNWIGIISALIVITALVPLTFNEPPLQEEKVVQFSKRGSYLEAYAKQFLRRHNLANYLDSEEAQDTWGEITVPVKIGRNTYMFKCKGIFIKKKTWQPYDKTK